MNRIADATTKPAFSKHQAPITIQPNNPSFAMNVPMLLATCSRLMIVCFALSVAGCLTARRPPPPPATCAVLLMYNGDELHPTPADFAKLEPKLGLYLRQRGFLLIRDVTTAEHVARVAYEPNPANPAIGDVFVHEIALNTFAAASVDARRPVAREHEGLRDAAAVYPRDIVEPKY